MIIRQQTNETIPSIKLVSSELKVAHYLCLGLKNLEIARHLYISEKTVKNHLSSIYRKLGVRNRIEAVLIMMKCNQLPLMEPVKY